MMGMGEKPQNEKKRKPRKKFPFGFPSIPASTKKEADCFPVFENTENKIGEERDPSLMGQKIQGWTRYR